METDNCHPTKKSEGNYGASEMALQQVKVPATSSDKSVNAGTHEVDFPSCPVTAATRVPWPAYSCTYTLMKYSKYLGGFVGFSPALGSSCLCSWAPLPLVPLLLLLISRCGRIGCPSQSHLLPLIFGSPLRG